MVVSEVDLDVVGGHAAQSRIDLELSAVTGDVYTGLHSAGSRANSVSSSRRNRASSL
jgi:hypothetical protein